MKRKIHKKTKKPRKYILLIAVLVILIAIVTFAYIKSHDGIKGITHDGIKGIIIGDTKIDCGVSDSICPSEYAGCEECIMPDPDCINVCGW